MAGAAHARLLAVLPEAALLVGTDGAIHAANPPAAELLLGARTLGAGRNLGEFAAGNGLAAFLRGCARSGQMFPGALEIADAAGRRRAFRAEGVLLEPRSPGGDALLFVRLMPKEAAVNQFAALNLRIQELNREIGRRRQAEQALRDERELLHVTLSSIGDAVLATDPAGRVTFMNPVAEALTGWTQAEAVGRPLHEVFVIVNEDTRAPVESPVERVLRENVVVGLANHTVLIKGDGSETPIDDAGAPIRAADGTVLGVVLVFRDIAERRAHERERAQAERRKDEFLAMLAHELRNPLAAIAAGVEVMRRMPGALAQGRGELATIGEAMHRQVRQLARLVDDLLDVSRLVTGKISLRRAPVALDAVVEDALAAHRPAIAERGIVLSWQRAPQPLVVHGDGERLGQVVGNLVSNAVKFNRPGGRLSVATGVEADCALVRVVDDGEGIAPEILPAVFDLFVQGDTSLARARGGLGVGLSVAKLITELHGGRIEAHSEGPGRGARFTVRLPLHAAAADAPASPAASARPAQSPGGRLARRVLVVDDNVDAASSLATLLALAGHEVRVAHDGESALRLHAELAAEIVLLDLGMPGMDGYEVARRLRQPGQGAPRIYALTGYGAERARVAAAGFDGHLTKPVDAETLEQLLGA